MSIISQVLARSRGERNLARINEGRVLGEVIIEQSQRGMTRMSPPREELRSTSHEHAAHCARGGHMSMSGGSENNTHKLVDRA